MPKSATPITGKAEVKTRRKPIEAVSLTPLQELQAIVDRVTEQRLKEVQDEMIEQELIEEYEITTRGNIICRLFTCWKKHMSRVEVGEPDYFKLKEIFMEAFEESEFNYWMYGEDRYLQKIIWLILKDHEGFCERYAIPRRKTMRLIQQCGWGYIIQKYNPKDGWKLESDVQADKVNKLKKK